MYDDESEDALVREVCGEDALQRLNRKRRGGDSFVDSNSYESQYGAHVFCLYAAESLRKVAGGLRVSEHYLDRKFRCFVDDVVILDGTRQPLLMVQLKRRTANPVRWSDDAGAMHQDFRYQHLLDRARDRAPEYQIVVPCNDNLKKLRDSRPDDLDRVEVVFFPDADFREVWRSMHDLRAAVHEIFGESNVPSPVIDAAGSTLWTHIIGQMNQKRAAPLGLNEALALYNSGGALRRARVPTGP